jgi:threonine aldolase
MPAELEAPLKTTAVSTPVTTIDLRSDTVTKPTHAMRAAMASAEVGDDVYGEDPTVNKLEARAAEIFGREASIFFPTGSMANQTAIRLHTQHGQEVVCEARSHIVDWEMGMVSAFSGCQLRTMPGDRGVLTWDRIKTALSPKIYYRAQTGLISLENSHNMAGGTVTSPDIYEEIWSGAREAGIPIHLDGARVFNAAAALNIPVDELTSGFSSVMFCLSKGLGAPVGSMLVGSRKFIERARSVRKSLGGGMRQAGILAAAGMIALEESPKLLHQDHGNARFLAESLSELKQVEIDLTTVQTNIVIFKVNGVSDVSPLLAQLKKSGILAGSAAADQIRFVTHYDVDRAACEEAMRVTDEILSAK